VTGVEPEGTPLDIRITGGNPSPEDIAATTAVLSAALEELGAEHGRLDDAGPSAWQRSQRPFRSPITTGTGVWRSFSG
jgi:hypothetical protein